jgi:hypothetical protein
MTRWADPARVSEAIGERWTPQQIECRTYGHNWRSLTVLHRPGVYTIAQRCSRCRNERQRDITEEGRTLNSWRHTYRRGYLLEGLGRVGEDSKCALRLASLDGMTIQEVEEDE